MLPWTIYGLHNALVFSWKVENILSNGIKGDYMKEKTCCFTGHRSLLKNEVAQIKNRLEEEVVKLIHQGVIYYGTGGAIGFDTLAALTILKLQKDFPQIRLILVLPCKLQEKYWNAENIMIYNQILFCANKVVYTDEHYHKGCMQKRNRHLVNNSAYCICYLKKATGGTASTVRYAFDSDLKIINLATAKKLR